MHYQSLCYEEFGIWMRIHYLKDYRFCPEVVEFQIKRIHSHNFYNNLKIFSCSQFPITNLNYQIEFCSMNNPTLLIKYPSYRKVKFQADNSLMVITCRNLYLAEVIFFYFYLYIPILNF
jgi:hypothetical protein